MKYPIVKCVYNRRCTASETKPAAVEIEIVFERKQKRISTGVRVLPSQWHPDLHVINHSGMMSLNMRIEAVKRPIMDYISRLMLEEEPFSFHVLDEMWKSQGVLTPLDKSH